MSRPRLPNERVGTGFVKRTLCVVAVVGFSGLFLLGAWQVRSVLFLLFLSVLLAVFWRGLSRLLTRVTPLPGRWAVGAVVLALGLLSALLGWLVAPPLVGQAQRLFEVAPSALQGLERALEATPLGAGLSEGLPSVPDELVLDLLVPRLTDFAEQFLGHLFGTVAATAGLVTNLVFLLFAALFFALTPDAYRRGLVRLVPKGRRARFDEVLRASGRTLWLWLLGRLVAMVSVAVMVSLGLWLLGVPLALLLGFIAFLLDFVPYIGPFVAALPALLLASTVSPLTVVWVAVLYLAAQQIESYLVTPIAQRWAVDMPPVLTLVAVFVFGGLFGFWGLLVGTPLMAVILVFVRELYLRDVLDDPPAAEGAAKLPAAARRDA